MHPNGQTIGEYMDDTLAPDDRRAVEQHLERCGECRTLIAELGELGRAVRALESIEPPARAWTDIARAIEKGPHSFSDGQGNRKRSMAPLRVRGPWTWLAAATAVMLITFLGLKLGPFWNRSATDGPAPRTVATAQSVEAELVEAERHYQNAISGLEEIANAEKGALDLQTVATLEKNLAVVDQAISESRAALRTQPTSEPAQQSLLESFKAKIALLQDTVALINEMRKGNEAGTARIVSGIKQKG